MHNATTPCTLSITFSVLISLTELISTENEYDLSVEYVWFLYDKET